MPRFAGFIFSGLRPLGSRTMIPTLRPIDACVHLIRVFVAFIVVCGTQPAYAGYVLSQSGPSTVTPGQAFEVRANMTALDSLNEGFDLHAWNVQFTGPRWLIYNGYLLNPGLFRTGGADDESFPKGAPDTGDLPGLLITGSLYPITPDVDVHLGGLTLAYPNPKCPFFDCENLATLRLQMPNDAQIGEVYDLRVAVDYFYLGFDPVDVQPGGPLRISVVPDPRTITLLVCGWALLVAAGGRSRL